MVFPVVMYRCENWPLKKAEHWKLMLLNCGVGEDSCTARRSNQSILKEISPEYSLEGLMLKLKLQSFATWCEEPTHWKKILTLGKIEGWKRKGRQRMRWLDGITDSMAISFGGLQELVMDRKAWRVTVHGVTKSRTQLSNWTDWLNSFRECENLL